MNKKSYYKDKFYLYNDIIGVTELCKMMGGIARTTAYNLIEEGCFKNTKKVKYCYCIPKKSVIRYLTSPAYEKKKEVLKHKV